MNPGLPQKKLEEARNLLDTYDLAQALLAYERLAKQFPRSDLIWFEYGGAACRAGQLELAGRAWDTALAIRPGNGNLMLQIGHQYQSWRRPKEARQWFEKAAAADPRGINPRMALAILFEAEHRFAEAREAIASCLAIDPDDDQARYYSAFLARRENKFEESERGFRDLIASNPRHQYVQYAARYELAHVLDRAGRFDEAMALLNEAKSLVRQLGDINAMLQEYDAEAVRYHRATKTLPKDIMRTWNREFPARAREPIPAMAFLGGHPRSGTTLIEQILGAHPAVAALDESRVFVTVAAKLFNESSQLPPARLNNIRRRYIQAMQREWNGSFEGKLILDKNPTPTFALRIWLRLFPELRVLIALRDPRDVVLSCYFQNLVLNPFNANFLTLERTVKHYTDIMDVWLAVRQWDGFAWMETRYEDTVADLEKEGRRVTEFLGLTWDDSQRLFYEKSSKKLMYSPTYHDASQPVYARSVARWHAYEKHLAPVLPLLEPYCRALGYA